MPGYDDMVARIRTETIVRVGRAIMEACFASAEEQALGYPGHWKQETCLGKMADAYAAKARHDERDIVLVTCDEIGARSVCLDMLTDTNLWLLDKFQWLPVEPLPPLVVLAKCAEGNLSCDRARDKQLEDML